jgi:hypothetical protein
MFLLVKLLMNDFSKPLQQQLIKRNPVGITSAINAKSSSDESEELFYISSYKESLSNLSFPGNTGAGFSTFPCGWLLRLHRACPSVFLDKYV